LVTTNQDAVRIDNQLQGMMHGREMIFRSYDSPVIDDPADHLAVNIADRAIESLNRKTPQGFPEHSIRIKEGSIVMLIRNIDVDDGLCNGTRMQVVTWTDNTITLRYINGPRAERGEIFVLYRSVLTTGGEQRELQTGGVKWQRTQFPIRPGFVLTINKAQGKYDFVYFIYFLTQVKHWKKLEWFLIEPKSSSMGNCMWLLRVSKNARV
jgi:ATP-dependent DNA helicase PIF1